MRFKNSPFFSFRLFSFSGPHFGGPAVPSRVFGGSTATQVCNAVRVLSYPLVVRTVKVNFLAPGSTDTPTDYAVERYADVLNITGRQKGKIFVTGKATVGNSPDLLNSTLYKMPTVQAPLAYPTLTHCMATTPDPKPWNVFKVLSEAGWFEVRPTDFDGTISTLRPERTMCFWATLGADYRDSASLERADGVSVVMLLSDYLIGCSGLVHRALIGSHKQFDGGASLSHIVTFHTHLIDVRLGNLVIGRSVKN
uniref:Thioesterase superfamily protein n=1 Tax=Steinernema glaseri TaxID=37863 RepID=A0A1I7ZG29_9BILA